MRFGAILSAWLCAASAGCADDTSSRPEGAVVAVDFDVEECATCGMTVRDQPSPRGQLVHSDGTRRYFCSVADLLTYLEAPSPHGAVTSVFVEANRPHAEDPMGRHLERRPWISASDATYVIGVERERIMGLPVLAYDAREEAARVARHLGGDVLDWEALQRRAAHPNH